MKTTLQTTNCKWLKLSFKPRLLLMALFAMCFGFTKGQNSPTYNHTISVVPSTDSLTFNLDVEILTTPSANLSVALRIHDPAVLLMNNFYDPQNIANVTSGTMIHFSQTVFKTIGSYWVAFDFRWVGTGGFNQLNPPYDCTTGCGNVAAFFNSSSISSLMTNSVNSCNSDVLNINNLKARNIVNGLVDSSSTLCANVSWGDGTTNTYCAASNSVGVIDFLGVNHQYPNTSSAISYNYTVTIDDPSGNACYKDQFTSSVTTAINMACTSSISHYNTTIAPQTCVSDTLYGALALDYSTCGSINNNGTALLSYVADWGDGQTTSGSLLWSGSNYQNFMKHHYSNPGTYTYKIKFNGATCSDSIIGYNTLNACGNLTGTVYNDINNDCNQNTSEHGAPYIQVTATLGSNVYQAWTDTAGHYSFGNVPVGNYLIRINGMSFGYTITCGNSLPHITNVSTTGTTVENFALHCNGFDVAVTGMMLWNGFFPGQYDAIFPEVFMLNNACNVTVPGQVKVVLTPCIEYTSGLGYTSYGSFQPFPTPSSVISAPTGDTIVWNVADINDLYYLSYLDAFLTGITTCPNAQVGDTACITVMVLPTNGDADPSNNSFTRCFAIGVAYDPNYKEVSPKGSGVQGYIPQDTHDLTYTLHFQNTGTAPARNIYLLDTISTNLNLETIEIVASSHPMQPYLLPNRTMKFMFANIMLPDSTHDELHSHGYVTYRIKPNASIPLGTQIKNTGYIYFDYNAPIVTNTTLNTIATPTGLKELVAGSFLSVYPNPAKDQLMVSVAKNENNIITITDILGKEVMQQKASGLQTELNVGDLQSGIYFIRVGQQTQKVVISK